MSKDSITVHALSPVVERQVQSSETDFEEDATLLSRGWAVAHAGRETTGWRSPNDRKLQDCFFKNAYTYLPAPPPVPTAAALTSSVAKEWGTRSSESEKFCTTDLNPFESRLFSSLRSYSPVGGDPAVPRVSRDRHWSLGSSSPSRPPTKRAKVVEVDTGLLDELIPLPHYVPAPLNSTDPRALPCAPLDVHPPSFVPIPPQTASSIAALFASVYARVAWLIPVRGRPPWDGVSRASVALGHLSALLPGGPSDPDVLWTRGSLRQFWAFLRSCSEAPGSVTGPLSLSFRAAPRSDHAGSQGGFVSSAASESAYLLANRETKMTPSDPSSPVPIISASRGRLTDVDYMKVYCDAPRAMWVRRTLGQWESREDGHIEDPRVCEKGTRILEFAKLVLVDEKGEGVLIS